MLGSILIMTQDPEAGAAAITGIQAGAQQVLINHTRSNEAEADRVGIATLANAGFDPTGMTRFFEKMLMLSRYSGMRLAFLSTHPLSQTRITESRDRARKLSFINRGQDPNFLLMKRRLTSTINQDFNLLKRNYISQRESRPNLVETRDMRYGLGLIEHKLGNHSEAYDILKPLVETEPENPLFLVPLAEVYIAKSQPEQAINLLQKPLQLNPGNDALTIAYGKALAATGDTKAALDLLYEHLPRLDREPAMYQLIADIQSQHGLFKEVHESTGLYLYHSGDLQGALSQFRMAISGKSDDPYFNARLSARIRKVQQEILLLK
jgi:predicted Zn-dependent protease